MDSEVWEGWMISWVEPVEAREEEVVWEEWVEVYQDFLSCQVVSLELAVEEEEEAAGVEVLDHIHLPAFYEQQ
jgi:hypothetical protein